MSYEPTVWKDGDLVTSAKLNKLEQGVVNGNGVLVVHWDENGELDRTWQEIYDADLAVLSSYRDDGKRVYPINGIYVENNTYYVSAPMVSHNFSTSAPDDYPTREESGGGEK